MSRLYEWYEYYRDHYLPRSSKAGYSTYGLLGVGLLAGIWYFGGGKLFSFRTDEPATMYSH